MKLDPGRVEEIFVDCLLREGEDTAAGVVAEGVVYTVWFYPERLNGHKEEIEALLEQLPDDFKRSGGGGMSFLNACYDRHGFQWTSFHLTMEHLFQLGMAVGKVQCLADRELWPMLPGGMPYYVVN